MNPVTLLTSLVCKERFQLLCVPVVVNMKKTHKSLVKSSNLNDFLINQFHLHS